MQRFSKRKIYIKKEPNENPIKVLFITQEISPYLPETEISTICRRLPQAAQEHGREIRTFMPKFSTVNERRNQLHEVIRLSGMNMIIEESDHPLIIKVASIQSARMQVYFIDNDDYFQSRYTMVDENGEEYADNDERVVFYTRGVMETVKKLRWTPDIIHCHGWITALAPLYIKKAYNEDPFFKNSKVIYSVYNDEFKNPFPDTFHKKLRIDGVEDQHVERLMNGNVDFNALTKLAIDYSDGIIQGSKNINGDLKQYIVEKNVHFLDYCCPETYIEKYNEFYSVIAPNQ